MATFADIKKHSEVTPVTWIDDTTPDGQWGATAKILGDTVTYYLTGEKDSDEATIVAREEHRIGVRYEGDGLKGGCFVGRPR